MRGAGTREVTVWRKAGFKTRGKFDQVIQEDIISDFLTKSRWKWRVCCPFRWLNSDALGMGVAFWRANFSPILQEQVVIQVGQGGIRRRNLRREHERWALMTVTLAAYSCLR